ncbi:MAG: sulfatase-like hydrolase/transferase [Verrucomicrobiales bacterium]|nr:sulfatase-like hydrolase/transferase [Verrucomicrobiales bacterium]
MRVLVFLVLFSLGIRAGAQERPNIVYIISDDQTWSDFGFMGNARVYTPHLDALAEKSARFPNGYLTTSVCRPSLVTLMTGLYPHQHKVHFNHGPPGNSAYNRMETREEYEKARAPEFELIKKVPTLPRILSRQYGYRCLQTGKFWEGHWKNGGFTEGMTTFAPPPLTQTYGGIRKLANGEKVAHGNGDRGLQIGRETMEPIESFISECEKEETPWMVWYAPYLPHQPHDSPEQFYDLAESTPGVREHEIPYFAAIAQFDETVGQLIDFVEKNADAANTIFVFVSDNGWSPSTTPQKGREAEYAHTKSSKRAPFDEGVRSPILIRWDGVVKPEAHPELVSSIDIVPTLLRTVNAKTKEFPGRNLLGDLESDRAVFGAIYPGDATSLGHPGRDVAYRWVRKGDWKLILPVGDAPWGNYLKGPALYEVAVDPKETKNRISEEGSRVIAGQLEKLLDDWWEAGKESER